MINARDTTWWSAWIREDVREIHDCPENTIEGVGVLFHDDHEGSPSWFICTTWMATEEDVARGTAPEVGDILRAEDLRIAFCPFCGAKLSGSG